MKNYSNCHYCQCHGSISSRVRSKTKNEVCHCSTKRKNDEDEQTVLVEFPVTALDITDHDLIEYSKQIGIDPDSESDLLWIAKKGLLANLPNGWLPVKDGLTGGLYYFCKETGSSSWEHPADSLYRSLVWRERERTRGSSTTVSMSGLTSLANLHFVDDELSFKSDNGIGNEKGASLSGGATSRTLSKSKTANKRDADDASSKLLAFMSDKGKPSASNAMDDEEAVESVDFELDVEEAIEDPSVADDDEADGEKEDEEEEDEDGEVDEEDEDEITVDVTDGGVSDVHRFTEVYEVQLHTSSDDNSNAFKPLHIGSGAAATEARSPLKSNLHNSTLMRNDAHEAADHIGGGSPAKKALGGKVSQGPERDFSSLFGSTKATVSHLSRGDDAFDFDLGDDEDPFAEFDFKTTERGKANNNVGSAGKGRPLSDEPARRWGAARKSSTGQEDEASGKSATKEAPVESPSTISSRVGFGRRDEESRRQTSGEQRVRDGKTRETEDADEVGVAPSKSKHTDAAGDEDNLGRAAKATESRSGHRRGPEQVDANNPYWRRSTDSPREDDMETKFETISAQLNAQIAELRNEIRDQLTKERDRINNEMRGRLEGTETRLESLQKKLSEVDEKQREEAMARPHHRSNYEARHGDDYVNKRDFDQLETRLRDAQADLAKSLELSMAALRDQTNKQIRQKVAESEQTAESKFEELRADCDTKLTVLKKDLSVLSASKRSLVDQSDRIAEEVDRNAKEMEKFKSEFRKELRSQESQFNEQREKLAIEIDSLRATLRKDTQQIRETLDSKCGAFQDRAELAARESQAALEKTTHTLDHFKLEQEAFKQQVESMHSNLEEKSRELERINSISAQEREVPSSRYKSAETKAPDEVRPGGKEGKASLTEKEMRSRKMGKETMLSDGEQSLLESRIVAVESSVKQICASLDEIRLIYSDRQSAKKDRPVNRKQQTTRRDAEHSLDDFETNGESETNSELSRGSSQLIGASARGNSRKAEARRGGGRREETRHERRAWREELAALAYSPLHAYHSRLPRHDTRDATLGTVAGHYPHFARVPLVTTAAHGDLSRYRDIKASSSSLLSLIKRTTKLLKDEAGELEAMGNYHFTSDLAINGLYGTEVDRDEESLKKLKVVRSDVQEKLHRLSDVINQNKEGK